MTQASTPDKESCSYLLAADPPNVPELPLKHACVSAICRKLSAEMAWNKVYIDFGIVPNILIIVAAGGVQTTLCKLEVSGAKSRAPHVEQSLQPEKSFPQSTTIPQLLRLDLQEAPPYSHSLLKLAQGAEEGAVCLRKSSCRGGQRCFGCCCERNPEGHRAASLELLLSFPKLCGSGPHTL